jgi:hypothetical protein
LSSVPGTGGRPTDDVGKTGGMDEGDSSIGLGLAVTEVRRLVVRFKRQL